MPLLAFLTVSIHLNDLFISKVFGFVFLLFEMWKVLYENRLNFRRRAPARFDPSDSEEEEAESRQMQQKLRRSEDTSNIATKSDGERKMKK